MCQVYSYPFDQYLWTSITKNNVMHCNQEYDANKLLHVVLNN